MAIHKTTFEVIVLWDDYDGDVGYDPHDLHTIAEDIDVGDCIGTWDEVKNEVIPDVDLTAELVAIGNDGSFFGNFD